MSKADCQTRILDAAERIFAEAGYDGAALRAIVARARVNLPTVYYHFGSKRGLLQAVFQRRFAPIHEEQMALLARLEAQARGQALAVEEVLKAMLLPPLRLAATGQANTPVVMRLIGRVVNDPCPEMQSLALAQRQEARAAFLQALRRSLPRVPLPSLRWRLECLWGSMGVVLCNPRRIERETGGVFDPLDTARVLPQLINYFAAGLSAPVISQTTKTKSKA